MDKESMHSEPRISDSLADKLNGVITSGQVSEGSFQDPIESARKLIALKQQTIEHLTKYRAYLKAQLADADEMLRQFTIRPRGPNKPKQVDTPTKAKGGK